jgi:hypothetical protein
MCFSSLQGAVGCKPLDPRFNPDTQPPPSPVIDTSSPTSMKKNLERREETDRRLPVEPQTKK